MPKNVLKTVVYFIFKSNTVMVAEKRPIFVQSENVTIKEHNIINQLDYNVGSNRT